MDPQSLPPIPAAPNQQGQPVPNMASPALNLVQEPPKKSHKKLIFSILAVILLVLGSSSAAGYFLYYLPRKTTTQKIATITKPLGDLKTSVSQINSLLQDISNLSLGKKGADSTSLQLSGLAIHPEIAQITQSTNVLGAQTTAQLGPFETDISNLKTEIISGNPIKSKPNSKVAGASTIAESQSTIDSRKIKDYATKALDTIDTSNKSLTTITNVTDNVGSLPQQNIAVLQDKTFKSSASNYLTEAGKISGYYNTLSGTTITLESKIQAYDALVYEVSQDIGAALTTNNLFDAKDYVDAAQITINKAIQETDDIKTLSAALNSIPQDQLPNASSAYQQHNLKVIATVTNYFSSETTIMKNFSTTLGNAITTAQQRPLTSQEVNTLDQAWNVAISQEHLAEANFTTDLTSLLGEEITLATSFWQDNGILKLSTDVNTNIDSYQKNLGDLNSANQIPFLKKTN